MNDTGFSVTPTMESGNLHWDFPEGTVIVKKVYKTPKPAAGEKPIQLTLMVKTPKDPHARGGWLWITRDLQDGKDSVFMGNFCITCHANASEKHPYGDGNPREEFRDNVYFMPIPASGHSPCLAQADAFNQRESPGRAKIRPDVAMLVAFRCWVLRPVDDPQYAMIDLEFDTQREAEALLAAMRAVWGRVEGKITANPKARIVEAVETKVFQTTVFTTLGKISSPSLQQQFDTRLP